MARLIALMKGGRGSAVVELALATPLVALFLVATAQIAAVAFRAQQNLVQAEATAARDILAREGSALPIVEHPCMEALGGGGMRLADAGPVHVLGHEVNVPKEVTFVVDPICNH